MVSALMGIDAPVWWAERCTVGLHRPGDSLSRPLCNDRCVRRWTDPCGRAPGHGRSSAMGVLWAGLMLGAGGETNSHFSHSCKRSEF